MTGVKDTVGLHKGGRPSKTGSSQDPVYKPTLDSADIDKPPSSPGRIPAASHLSRPQCAFNRDLVASFT